VQVAGRVPGGDAMVVDVRILRGGEVHGGGGTAVHGVAEGGNLLAPAERLARRLAVTRTRITNGMRRSNKTATVAPMVASR
jgi:hypothetical protein